MVEDQRGPDRPRRHRIHADVALGEHLGEPGGEIVDRALGRRIGEQLLVGLVGVDRGRVDDRRALAHVRQAAFTR
jgi:hypothetical protein